MNFMTCDVSAATTAHNVWVPFKNNDYTNTSPYTTALTVLLDPMAPTAASAMTKSAGAKSLELFSKIPYTGTLA